MRESDRETVSDRSAAAALAKSALFFPIFFLQPQNPLDTCTTYFSFQRLRVFGDSIVLGYLHADYGTPTDRTIRRMGPLRSRALTSKMTYAYAYLNYGISIWVVLRCHILASTLGGDARSSYQSSIRTLSEQGNSCKNFLLILYEQVGIIDSKSQGIHNPWKLNITASFAALHRSIIRCKYRFMLTKKFTPLSNLESKNPTSLEQHSH